MTDFQISCSPGSDWMIGFTDKNGAWHLLPRKSKWFGHWKTTNCPKRANYLDVFKPTATDGKVVVVSDGMDENLTPDQALDDFKKEFNSVEEYLGWLND